MKRDLLIPSSWNEERLVPLLASISASSVLPDMIVFLIHWSPSADELLKIESMITISLEWKQVYLKIVHHQNANYTPWQGTWFDRNFLVNQASAEYVFMIDDDNVFDEDFFERCLEEHDGTSLFSPIIEWRKTWTIQSRGIAWFRWRMPRYSYAHTSEQKVIMIWANSLLWPRALFASIPFDPLFRTTLEDIDFSYRVTLSGIPILVSKKISIHHMETEKSFLQTKFLWSPTQAYERSKNRILFAKKNATPFQKLQYFGLGVWVQTFWFVVIVLVYGGGERLELTKKIALGSFDWFFDKR